MGKKNTDRKWRNVCLSYFHYSFCLPCECALLQVMKCAHINTKEKDKQATTKCKTQLALMFRALRHTKFSCSNVSLCCVCKCGRTCTTHSPSLFPYTPFLFFHIRESHSFDLMYVLVTAAVLRRKNAFLWAFFEFYLRRILIWRNISLEWWKIVKIESNWSSK